MLDSIAFFAETWIIRATGTLIMDFGVCASWSALGGGRHDRSGWHSLDMAVAAVPNDGFVSSQQRNA
jgi:hypothetical protein